MNIYYIYKNNTFDEIYIYFKSVRSCCMEGQTPESIYNPKTTETKYLNACDKFSTNGGVVNAAKFKRA